MPLGRGSEGLPTALYEIDHCTAFGPCSTRHMTPHDSHCLALAIDNAHATADTFLPALRVCRILQVESPSLAQWVLVISVYLMGQRDKPPILVCVTFDAWHVLQGLTAG